MIKNDEYDRKGALTLADINSDFPFPDCPSEF